MQLKPQTRIFETLTSSELIILRSIALGLGCDTIRDLLEISKETYESHCQSLFQKLQVCNAYAAVQKAYYNNLLKNKEYTPEKELLYVLKQFTSRIP
ncbi:LuxR C-terminal-related transcriptional regulator [Flavobacteriaceae bacterium]|nr:LuxR C-terminal-related transcriptional regulator [Flavobacteriaceae bacterium]